MKILSLVLLIVLAACSHDKLVGPRHCTIVTNRGLHADTSYVDCQQ